MKIVKSTLKIFDCANNDYKLDSERNVIFKEELKPSLNVRKDSQLFTLIKQRFLLRNYYVKTFNFITL